MLKSLNMCRLIYWSIIRPIFSFWTFSHLLNDVLRSRSLIFTLQLYLKIRSFRRFLFFSFWLFRFWKSKILFNVFFFKSFAESCWIFIWFHKWIFSRLFIFPFLCWKRINISVRIHLLLIPVRPNIFEIWLCWFSTFTFWR